MGEVYERINITQAPDAPGNVGLGGEEGPVIDTSSARKCAYKETMPAVPCSGPWWVAKGYFVNRQDLHACEAHAKKRMAISPGTIKFVLNPKQPGRRS